MAVYKGPKAWYIKTMENKTATLKAVLAAKAAEKAAKDAFYATAKANTKVDQKLYKAMITATKARQAAMTAYAATL